MSLHVRGIVLKQSLRLVIILATSIPVFAAAPLSDEISVAFSPGSKGFNAKALVLTAIDDAENTLRVAAYSFTSQDVAKALVNAHKRGVDVQVVLDKSHLSGKYSSATFLTNQGMAVRINSRYSIMHNKFIVVDGHSVQTGSFNFSKAADEKNAENAIYIRGNAGVADAYSKEWARLWSESEIYIR